MDNDFVEIEYPEPEYALFDTSREGLPAVVAVNAALLHFPHRDVFGWHLSILIFANEVAEQGMPTSNENRVIGFVGDEIEQVILANQNALFLARETWNGRKQILFRVHDPDETNDSLQSLLARSDQQREWDFRMEGDPSWSLAEPVLALLESGT